MANLSHEDRELINNRVGAAGARAIQSGSLVFGIATGIISSVYYLSFGLTMVTAAFSSVSIIYLLIYVATVKKYLGKTQRIWAGMLMFALPMLLAMAVIIRTANLFALPFAIITLFAAAFFITDAYLFLVLIALNIISYLIIFWQEPLDYSLRLLAGLVFVWLLSLFVNRIVIASLHRLERLRLQEKRFREQLEREVHEREQAQAALATAYAQVEQQVTERTQALNNSLAREKDLSLQLETSLAKEVQLQQMKTNIINNVSHEFRTPLHIINMSTDLLMEYREQLSAAQSDKYQSNIKEQVFYMTDMIQDILFVNSGYEITLDKRPFRFNDLVQQLQKDLI
ncbi:MAG: histidine kinase dimerization/phospho-acceptor domain-containing protein [Chloroflexota bacterium]